MNNTTFDNISPPFCTLAILWPPCKILRKSSQGNPYIEPRGRWQQGASETERCHVRASHLL